MIPVSQVGTICIVSVHDEEEPIHFSIPGVTPSRYEIPGINAPKEQFKQCVFSFPDGKKLQYAVKRTINHHPYVLIKIVEPHQFVYGTESQKLDEYGKVLSPDIQRIPVPVRMEAVANEIERQCGKMGMMAIQGEVTLQAVLDLEVKSISFMRARVADTNKLSKRSLANVTSQAKRSAWQLHKKGLLNPLPDWADINPGAEENAQSVFNCGNCGTQLRRTAIKCPNPGCGVIYNWLEAVNSGLVKPSDVPPSKRVEAGLEKGSDDTRETSDPVSAPIKENHKEDDDAFDSLMTTDEGEEDLTQQPHHELSDDDEEEQDEEEEEQVEVEE